MYFYERKNATMKKIFFLEGEFHYKKKFHCEKKIKSIEQKEILLEKTGSLIIRKSQWKRNSF